MSTREWNTKSSRILAGLLIAFAFAVPCWGQSAQEPEPAAPAQAEPAASEPAASEPAASEPAASEPEPAASEPEPAASEPAAPEPAASEPAASEPEPAASEPQTPVTAARATAAAVQEAALETGDAMTRGAGEIADQGSAIWSQILLPMWQRIAGAVPSLVKALLVLLLFWIVAVVLGMLVRKLLSLTKVDERAAEDWGLRDFLHPKEGESRALSELAGKAVKWLVLLFGLVAFFQTLDLQMVAAPLQNIAETIVGIVPNVLAALIILFAYWILATLVRLGVLRLLAALRFDERAGKYLAAREEDDERALPSALVGSLCFYVILLFGLAPFLEALGQTALIAPLTTMLAKALGFLPNVVAALLLFFVGKIVATIVREVVVNFLAAAGIDRGADKLGVAKALGSQKLSGVLGAVTFFLIIIPVIVAAVDALQIKAISDPVKATLEQMLAAVPLLFVAILVLAIGYLVARAVRGIVESFLSGVGFDGLPGRFGLELLAPGKGKASLSQIGGVVVMAVILLLTAQQALATLRLDQLSELVGGLIGYLPSLLVGLVIVLAAFSLAGFASRLVAEALGDSVQARIAVPMTRYAILFLGFSMGLTQLGVGKEIVTIAVAAAFGGTALALGLSFGLGGRDKAKELIESSGG